MEYVISERSSLDLLLEMQDGLVSRATGGDFPAVVGSSDPAYKSLRKQLIERGDARALLPSFVQRNRDLDQFWQFIKRAYGSYAERREFLWDSFRPAVDHLEAIDRSSAATPIGEALERFNPYNVHAYWQKALDRRTSDPDGAITATRSLLENTCKHVLVEAGTDFPTDADLPKLWALCAEHLNLAPQQHQEKIFRNVPSADKRG